MNKAKTIALCAIMIALALALSWIERFIPLQLILPLPGIKLGLANIVILLGLYLFKARFTLAILLLRCILGALFGGGITGLMFSLWGGIFAIIVMIGAKKLPFLSIYGVSILGAAAHNIGQILAAMVLMRSLYVAGYLPYLLCVAIFTGFLTGSICAGLLSALPYRVISIPENMRP